MAGLGARPMGVVMFYHLTRSPAVQTLAAILPRAVQAQWRVLIRSAPQVLADLDRRLWEAPGFLPHALADAPRAGDHPIVLGAGPSTGFDALVLMGGTQGGTDLAELAPLQRVWVLFDAEDTAQITAARQLWREVSAAGLFAQYWSEDSGKWAKKTEVNSPAQT